MKYPLIWMIEEATKAGLNFNPRAVNQLAWGVQRKNSPFSYVPPGISGEAGARLGDCWNISRRARHTRNGRRGRPSLGLYIPYCELGFIPEGAHVHEKKKKRMELDPTYRPVNLPATFATVPMPVPPHADGTVETG